MGRGEDSRQDAEEDRGISEGQRISAESARNEAEQARLKAGVGGLFKDRWGREPQRSAVAVLPWVETDGDVVNWKLALRRLGVR